jgi:hypothetical protein
MVVPLFAMPPPQILIIWPIGFLFVLLIAGLLAWIPTALFRANKIGDTHLDN